MVAGAIASCRAELLVISGRRGVGKSALLAQTLCRWPRLYYQAARRALPLQLAALTAMAREAYPDERLAQPFASLDALFDFIATQARQRPTQPSILILDDLPLLADAAPGFVARLQGWWERHRVLGNLKLFLASSDLAFMQRQALGAGGALSGPEVTFLNLQPFDYHDAALFFPEYSPRQRLVAYAILGGLPAHLVQFSPDVGIGENLLRTALRPSTFLREEPDWMLLEGLRRDVTHASILRAIAAGQRRPGDVARAIGKPSGQAIGPQWQTLLDLGLVRREVPVTDRNRQGSRTSRYWVADNYLAFWYRFLDPARSLLALGAEERVLEWIHDAFDDFVSRPIFADVCRQFLRRALAAGRLPPRTEFDAVGAWWNASHEIDVVAQRGDATVLVASCTWRRHTVGLGEWHALRGALHAAADELRPTPDCWLALFSRDGFDPGLAALARDPAQRLLLYEPADLFEL